MEGNALLRIVRIRRTGSTPVYTISMASRLTALPIWTIRWIERHELIEPQRTEGNRRLFSDAEIELLNQIRELMEDDINLPGIRRILQLHLQLARLAGERSQALRPETPGKTPVRATSTSGARRRSSQPSKATEVSR